MKKKFDSYITILVILILLVIIGIIILSSIVLNCKNIATDRDVAEIVINIALGISTFIGTGVLGIVAIKQSQRANDISELVLKKDMVTNLIIQKEVDFSIDSIDLTKTLKFAEDYPTEGVYCVTKNEKTKGTSNKYLSIRLYFKSLNASPEHMWISSCGINSSFINDEMKSDYCLPFEIKNLNKEVCFIYDPTKEVYVVEFYLFSLFDKIKSINEAGLFVFDFEIKLDSIFGQMQTIKYLLNFSKIDPKIFDNEKIDKHSILLDNVIVQHI